MLVTCNGPVPELCNVMVFVLVVPTTRDEKDNVVGVIEAAGVVPVPLSVTTCSEPKFPESSLTFSVPVSEPAAGGGEVWGTRAVGAPRGAPRGHFLVPEPVRSAGRHTACWAAPP